MDRNLFLDRLDELMQNEKIDNAHQLALKTKIPDQTIRNWYVRNSCPAGEYLIKLADFFEVTIDYLVGRADIWNSYIETPPAISSPTKADSYTPEEKRIITMLRKLPPEMKHVAVGAIEAVSKIELQREEQADKTKKADRL